MIRFEEGCSASLSSGWTEGDRETIMTEAGDEIRAEVLFSSRTISYSPGMHFSTGESQACYCRDGTPDSPEQGDSTGYGGFGFSHSGYYDSPYRHTAACTITEATIRLYLENREHAKIAEYRLADSDDTEVVLGLIRKAYENLDRPIKPGNKPEVHGMGHSYACCGGDFSYSCGESRPCS